MADAIKWRDPFEDPSDWNDGGPVLLLRAGEVISASLLIDEVWTGEDEIPSPELTLQDGTHPSFYDFDGWAIPEKETI
jgi:hypothetical protein